MKTNMYENFQKLEERTIEALYDSDLQKINHELSQLTEPTIVTGVGGSSVVSTFASRVLNEKNGTIALNCEPRDIKYMNLSNFKNVLSCSYSGNNYGVTIAFLNNLKHYLLSSKENNDDSIINLTYKSSDEEHSFISLASTLIPCTILLNYYLNNEYERIIDEHLEPFSFSFNPINDVYEIFSGIETSTASKFLETTMVESGIGIPIIHDKYAYCHGRSTINTIYDNIAIYFNTHTELDFLLISELKYYYKEILILNCEEGILGEYRLLRECMYLTKAIAEKSHKDLSDVKHSQITKKLYRYRGNL